MNLLRQRIVLLGENLSKIDCYSVFTNSEPCLRFHLDQDARRVLEESQNCSTTNIIIKLCTEALLLNIKAYSSVQEKAYGSSRKHTLPRNMLTEKERSFGKF